MKTGASAPAPIGAPPSPSRPGCAVRAGLNQKTPCQSLQIAPGSKNEWTVPDRAQLLFCLLGGRCPPTPAPSAPGAAPRAIRSVVGRSAPARRMARAKKTAHNQFKGPTLPYPLPPVVKPCSGPENSPCAALRRCGGYGAAPHVGPQGGPWRYPVSAASPSPRRGRPLGAGGVGVAAGPLNPD